MWTKPEPDRHEGFTLLELVIVVAIVGILAAAALPLARWSVKRSKEHELQQALRMLRTAIDRYHDAASAGLIEVPEGASGYPPSLEVLVEGVPLVQEMPSPAPPVVGEYAASGAGLTGGLQALVEAQQAAAGGGPGIGSGSTSPSGGGAGRGSPSATAGPRMPGLFGRDAGADVPAGVSTPARPGSVGGRDSPFADRSSPFASRPSAFATGAAADADDDGQPGQPVLGPDGQPVLLRFLRRLPLDPMTGEADWGLRCYGEAAEDRLWCGTDVFDVYSKSPAQAIDGTAYRNW